MLMEADLPNDVEALRALVLEQARELDALKVFQAEVERLKAIIEALQRHRFGRRSEQLDPDQFELALEEVETALAEAQHAMAKASKASADRPRKANRGSLPAHVERIEQVIDVEDKVYPCCGSALHQIGEDVAERLDVVPTTFRVPTTEPLAIGQVLEPLSQCRRDCRVTSRGRVPRRGIAWIAGAPWFRRASVMPSG